MDDEHDECARCGADIEPDDNGEGSRTLDEDGESWLCVDCAAEAGLL